MALLNAATILAGRGRRVLMIDFDLEAPGLTLFQRRQSGEDRASTQPGLVEMIHDFLHDPNNSPLADKENKGAFRERYVRSIFVPEHLRRLEGGRLDLIPCGRLDKTYEKRLYDIKFDRLYAEGIGQPLFRHVKNVISTSRLYDYVLIDSRTGLSDEGSICTNDLADHLVVLTGLNRQNVEGTARFLSKLVANDWKRGRVAFVASPVPVHYEELREQRIAGAYEIIKESGFPANLVARIPYHPRLALDEDPFEHDWSTTDLFSAYEDVVSELREMAQDDVSTWRHRLLEAFRQKQYDEAERYVRELAAESREAAESLFLVMSRNIEVQNEPIERSGLERIFKSWLTFAEDPLDVRQRYADLLIQGGYEEEALEVLEVALQEAAAARSARDEAYALYKIGNIYLQHGRHHDALEAYEAMLAIDESIGDWLNAALARDSIGQVHEVQGKYDRALALYEEALVMFEGAGNRHGAAVTRARTGDVHRVRGEYDRALALYEEALAGLEEVGDRRSAAVVRAHVGDVHRVRGEYDRALALYEEALAGLEEVGDRRSAAGARLRVGLIKERVQAGGRGDGIATVQQGIDKLKMLGLPRQAATGHVYIADLICMREGAEAARSYLDEHWSFIQQYADADVRAEAFVVRARARSSLGDTAGVMADAREALAFYRAQNVRTALAEEAAQLAGEAYPSGVMSIDEEGTDVGGS